jgi:hypothetical protein
VKKPLLILLILFSLAGKGAYAAIPDDVEAALALLRIPAVCAANGIDPESPKQKGFQIAADVIRLCGQVLSIINKNGKYDLHAYDYTWSAYDAVSLITHIKHLFSAQEQKEGEVKEGEDEEVDPAEAADLKKLNTALNSLHTVFLPFIEGVSAFYDAAREGQVLNDANFRFKC